MSKNFELLMQIEQNFNSVPAEIPARPERTAIAAPSLAAVDVSHLDRELAKLVQRVFLPANGGAERRVVFCGIEPSNASTSICARTARSLAAQTGERVCLVDANSSAAGLTEIFDVASDVARETRSNGSEQLHPVGGNLWLTNCRLTDGNGQPRSGGELRTILTELERDFGYVLIDAPGCALNDDATVLGQLSDAVILVIEAETTHRVAAAKAKRNFEAAGVRLAGTVLHNRSFPIPKALYDRL
jgi:Mrp family chromosome partitioning ATPase